MQKHAVILTRIQRRPNFFCRKRQYWRNQSRQHLQNMVQRRLCCAAWLATFGRGVQTIFQNIQIKSAQIFGAEILDELHCRLEFVFRVMR